MMEGMRRAAVAAVLCPLLAAIGCGSHSAPERTIAVRVLDAMRFEPDRIEVRAGERVRFVVTNPGRLPHEFVVGPEDVQQEHEEAMARGGDHHERAIVALVVNPGNTKRVSVRFDRPGQLVVGCHVAGHYRAGMRGVLIVV